MPISLTLDELRQRHGENSARRQVLFARFQTVLRLLSETGQLRRLYLLGSFPTTKPAPGDLDRLAVMAAGFTTANLASPHLEVFQHDTCRLLYQTDVFWVTESVGQEQWMQCSTSFPETVRERPNLLSRSLYDY